MGAQETIRIGPAPRIAVDHAGAGDLVMLLHGIGGSRGNWSDQLSVFAERFHVAAWDARGYGDSDDYEGPLDFSDFSRDLARVLDHFDAERAHIVGQSMGGRIALDFYALFPERVASLVLAGVHASFGEFTEDERRAFVAARRKPLVEDGKTPAEMAPDLARALVAPDAANDAFERVVASISKLHVESYVKTVKATTRYDRSGVLGDIAVPTLVIGGEHDTLTPPERERELAERIPAAILEIVPGAGHMVNIERADEFNRLVLGFLS